jgi:hypothetical protein
MFIHKIQNEKAQLLTGKVTTFENILINNWNFEERELLKKSLLSFGFNRWSHIQTCFREHKDFGLREKSYHEIKAYSKSLIKSIADNLNYKNFGLRLLLLSMISNDSQMGNKKILEKESQMEPTPPNQVLFVNSRDWDLNLIRQRAKPWAKRLQIMYRINNFIHDFQNYYYRKFNTITKSFLDYSSMLDYLHKNLLGGQKPSVWWTKIFDIHLVLNTFNIGYANYNFSFLFNDDQIPEGASIIEYLSKDDDNMKNYFDNFKADFYAEILNNDMPNADAITRRMKKLVQLIYKVSEEGVNEENVYELKYLDADLDPIPVNQKKKVMDFVMTFGLPYQETVGVTNTLNADKFKKEFLSNLNKQGTPDMINKTDPTISLKNDDSLKITLSETNKVSLASKIDFNSSEISNDYMHKFAKYYFEPLISSTKTMPAPLYENHPAHLPVSGTLSTNSKISYDELRCRLKSETSLNASGIEKLVQGLKLISYLILNERDYDSYIFDLNKHNTKVNELASLLDKHLSEKFLRHLNIAHMVRKYLVGKGLFSKHFKDFKTRIMSIQRDCEKVIILKRLSHFNFCEILLAEVNDYGFLRLDELAKFVNCTEQDLYGKELTYTIKINHKRSFTINNLLPQTHNRRLR